MIAAVFCLTFAVLAVYAWAYYNLEAQHRRLEASAASSARLLFRQRRKIQQLTAERDEARRRLAISNTVCDTLAFDLAEAVRPITDWTPPVYPAATPVHDAVVVDLFAKQLEQPSEGWPL